jgi:hypothetical protein
MYSLGIFFAALQQGEDRVVISSSRGSQRSCYRRDGSLSIFTQHLLEALAGHACQPGDTVVPVTRLFGYLSQQVPRSARDEYQAEQTPWCELAAEDFPVALLLGGKGLAALASSGRPALSRRWTRRQSERGCGSSCRPSWRHCASTIFRWSARASCRDGQRRSDQPARRLRVPCSKKPFFFPPVLPRLRYGRTGGKGIVRGKAPHTPTFRQLLKRHYKAQKLCHHLPWHTACFT